MLVNFMEALWSIDILVPLTILCTQSYNISTHHTYLKAQFGSKFFPFDV